MRNKIAYEWCCEWVDEQGDRQDLDFADTLQGIWPPDPNYGGDLKPELALLRRLGNDEDGEVDRQHAYQGDIEFDGGAAIPKKLKEQLELSV